MLHGLSINTIQAFSPDHTGAGLKALIARLSAGQHSQTGRLRLSAFESLLSLQELKSALRPLEDCGVRKKPSVILYRL
jgi:hypothetical protein